MSAVASKVKHFRNRKGSRAHTSMLANTPTRSAASVAESISYMPLPPPIWAHIDTDNVSTEIPVMLTVPDVIPLDVTSSCSCKEPRNYYDSTKPSEHRRCIVYGILNASETTIEVQKCHSCPHGYIGPEGSSLSIFNLNNRTLLSLALLDDYTSHFTKSETPFVSWVASTSCRYQNFRSNLPFIKEKVFRSAWFSYARLLSLTDDMRCTKCGPAPTVTIWDGVTLSFSRKNLLSTLQPPTLVGTHSEIKGLVRTEAGLQFISDRSLRKDVNTILQGPGMELPSIEPGAGQPSQSVVNMMERIGLLPGVAKRLMDVDASIGNAFESWVVNCVLFERRKPHQSHKDLLIQVETWSSPQTFLLIK
jgi:hypothetical protein